MQALAIVNLSVLAAVVYGILHDQITARICLEYFTIGHPQLLDSDSPTVLGLFWGVVATWWVGLPLGAGLAFSSRYGNRPKLSVSELTKPVGALLILMFGAATLGGIVGFLTARGGMFHLTEPLASRLPADRHVAFLTCGWAHSASYLSGIVGGVWLCVRTWRRRAIPTPNTQAL